MDLARSKVCHIRDDSGVGVTASSLIPAQGLKAVILRPGVW